MTNNYQLQMSHHFINRYCNVTVSPEAGISIQLSGWITYATADMLLLTDEDGDEIPISRQEIRGSIEIMEVQREMSVCERNEHEAVNIKHNLNNIARF